jgi:hypothetical protein
MLKGAIVLNPVLGLAVAAAAALAALTAVPTAASTAASADAVLDWYRYAGQAVNQAAQERGQPQRARLEMAMVQGAVYVAVNAIARTTSPIWSRRRRNGGTPTTPRPPLRRIGW